MHPKMSSPVSFLILESLYSFVPFWGNESKLSLKYKEVVPIKKQLKTRRCKGTKYCFINIYFLCLRGFVFNNCLFAQPLKKIQKFDLLLNLPV
jgi:hypothetical protein